MADLIARKERVDLQSTPHDQPRTSSPISDNYYANVLMAGLLAGSLKAMNFQTPQTSFVNLSIVNLAHIAKGHSQNKDISPDVVNCFQPKELKYVNNVSCVAQLSFVKPLTNVQTAFLNLPVGVRLQNFWKTWEALGAGPNVLNMLKQGYMFNWG